MPDLMYLFIGNDPFLVDNAVEQLVKKLDVDPFNVLTYDLDEHGLDELLQEMNTISFFADKKIIKIKHPWFFYEEKTDDYLSDLIKYFHNPNEDTTLIFMLERGMDASLPATKEAKKYVRIETVADMAKEDFKPYVKKAFESLKYTIEDLAVDELLERTNFDISMLNNEIAKLKLFAFDDKRIALKDIKQLVARNLEENIFELTNAVLAKNKKRILEVYYDLLEKNEDPIRIIFNISSKLKETIQTKQLLEKGYNQEAIASYFNVKSSKAYYMVKNAQQISKQNLESLYEKLSNLDYDIKSGRMDKKLGLELFLLEV
jgi:DNA polymerase III subunit delta